MKSKADKFKTINFYEVYTYDPEKEAKKKLLMQTLIPLGVAIILVLGTFGYFKIDSYLLNKKIDELNGYYTSQANIEEYKSVKSLRDERDVRNNTFQELNTIRSQMAIVPTVTETLMKEIKSQLGSATDDKYMFDAQAGTMVIEMSTPTVQSVPSVVDGLKTIPVFNKVDYKGYNGNDEETGVWYKATITCHFNS
ncbi:MAG: hypothetical protein RR967_02360 [Anaerovoracaceae bacterium]